MIHDWDFFGGKAWLEAGRRPWVVWGVVVVEVVSRRGVSRRTTLGVWLMDDCGMRDVIRMLSVRRGPCGAYVCGGWVESTDRYTDYPH